MRRAETPEQKGARDAAYERGWVDSLDAHYAISCQPASDIYWYGAGWNACAKYRWDDPANSNGTASDRNFRIPRETDNG